MILYRIKLALAVLAALFGGCPALAADPVLDGFGNWHASTAVSYDIRPLVHEVRFAGTLAVWFEEGVCEIDVHAAEEVLSDVRYHLPCTIMKEQLSLVARTMGTVPRWQVHIPYANVDVFFTNDADNPKALRFDTSTAHVVDDVGSPERKP